MRGGGFTFSQVPKAEIPRSSFNRSHGHKTTFDAGYLIPIFADEALPGDTFDVQASIFARLATPIAPLMDNLHLDVFWFAVPNRLLWSNWQRFCGEQDSPGDSIDYLVPVVEAPETSGWTPHTIFDYLGFPLGIPGIQATSLHLRAYNLIWNEWFRDQNLQTPATVEKGDSDLSTNYGLRKRGKRHDYFTSALPWPQKGEGVELSLGTSAPVLPIAANSKPRFKVDELNITNSALSALSNNAAAEDVQPTIFKNTSTVGAGDIRWVDSGLYADLSQAAAVTINSMRQAFQIQKLLERDARGGTRYVELLKSHFGVTSPDARLQRPEFLGGGTVAVNINPVAQTSGTGAYTATPQGNLAGYGIAGGSKGLGFTKSFVEHCVILGIVCARADLSYQQGLPRMYSRRTRYDFYWPAFAHLGEQAVLNKEIYAQGPSVLDPLTNLPMDDSVFGYQERWAEYRYAPARITGRFRSTDTVPLDFWHLAQEFETLPTLSAAFIEENPPMDRVVAVPSEPDFIFDSHFRMKCTRPMPTYSVPGYIDHF